MSMLWGSTFFMNKELVATMPPGDLTALRFGIAALVLMALAHRQLAMSAATLGKGLVIGSVFAVSQLLQTFGLVRTSASISGFLTGLYVVLTPLGSALLMRRRLPLSLAGSVCLAALALGVLTLGHGGPGGGFGIGEFLTIGCAVGFACHILVTGAWVRPENVMQITVVQTATVALWSLPAALPGGLAIPHGAVQWAAVGYLAVLCSCLTMFLQSWAQARTDETRAAVIMSAEPAWSAVFAILAGQEALRARTVLGGLLMLAAMWLAIAAPALPRWRTHRRAGRVPGRTFSARSAESTAGSRGH
ncbi:Permease of the drug/metabolite transporter (DMT) superfamily [Propionibacterium cyclohexanicum]|uniref:Permease of the drug/metabolite transporter (DMT) superfamily n=2 Tax=Propionibacterium cyclohexanicum TaxID=64702 RepID=A0A1H9PIL8_9ACTN|nr:Permease of the drug/metabolite transporter (DMT) superfamily [Propionibacterium cyclohexanicum]